MLLSYITISNISPLTSEWYRRDNGKDKVRIKKNPFSQDYFPFHDSFLFQL